MRPPAKWRLMYRESIRSLRHRVSPETRDALRGGLERALQIGRAAQLWQWEMSRFEGAGFDVLYCGRAEQRWRGVSLFPVAERQPKLLGPRAVLASERPTVLISEAFLPESLLVPSNLSSLVALPSLGKDILTGFDRELRRRVRRLSEQGYRLAPVTSAEEIARLHHQMFVPFTLARHPDHPTLHALEEMQRYPTFGRIDLLLRGDEEVGAQMGYSYARHGTCRWMSDRFGYPEHVYRDPRALSDANIMNIYLACQAAVETGHAFYDLGASPARPDDGLLEFKRRLNSVLERCRESLYFYVRVPSAERPEIFWHAPLFSLEGEALHLHVGVGESEAALCERFRGWSFGGLHAVNVWAHQPLSPSAVERIESHYRDRGYSTRVRVHVLGEALEEAPASRAA